jgi:predicted CoA-substrate-specific enzyme activase
MRCVGIDIGSRTIEVAVTDDGRLVDVRQAATGYAPEREAARLLEGLVYDRILATGYGRNLFAAYYKTPTVTEIRAVAAGMHHLEPDIALVLDIGGQDSKVIALGDHGRVVKFEMNDRCAAGTGRFLEIMAATLGFTVDEFGRAALEADASTLRINSMCAVFTESEVISLIGRGKDRRDIAYGLHRAVVDRAAGMLRRFTGKHAAVGFVGGVALNPCISLLLAEQIGATVRVPEHPQAVAAHGAALLAAAGRRQLVEQKKTDQISGFGRNPEDIRQDSLTS